MKPVRFVQGGLWIEYQRGGHFLAYSKGSSLFLSSHKDLLRWANWPKGTPTRLALDEWLAALPVKAPEADETELADRIKAEGFGPESHLDETDPNYATKTII
jgi:hypothetical protein